MPGRHIDNEALEITIDNTLKSLGNNLVMPALDKGRPYILYKSQKSIPSKLFLLRFLKILQ